MRAEVFIHPSATVDPAARVGRGTKIWHHAQVRERARIGRECVVGSGAYIDVGVSVGDRVKIENGALLFAGATVGDGAFIGPLACLANDRRPRATNPDGTIKTPADWRLERVRVGPGASLGAGAIVVPPARIGAYAIVGAGAVVVGDVASHALVVGNPARHAGWVCRCAARLTADGLRCASCGRRYARRGAGLREAVR